MLSRYQRSHPHFIRNMSIDLILSLAIGFAGFQVVSSRISTPKPLEYSQVRALTSEQFVALVKTHKDPVYWLGSLSGNKYSFEQNVEDIDIVSYLPKGSSLSNVNQRKMTIKTYKNPAAYASHIHPLVGADAFRLATSEGNIVEFDRNQMDIETVILRDRPQIVVIRYPIMQTSDTMIRNADRLRLVR